jgi:molybdenum cofactor cytidylyltransferase
MRYRIDQCGIVVLAAGKSSRLGSPKQLLEFGGTKLVVKAVETASHSNLYPVIVVLGAHAEKIKGYLNFPGIAIVENEEWEEGMASSIRCGLTEMDRLYPHVDGIIIMVCDQPLLHPEQILRLIDLQDETGLPVSAASYAGVLGTPALFHKSVFPELMNLNGDTGARKLLNLMKDEVAELPFEGGMLDIDTQEDYQALLNLKNEES